MSDHGWEPPHLITREAIVAASLEVLGRIDHEVIETPHVLTLNELGLEWDIGYTTYEPAASDAVPFDPSGARIGFFLLHGGSSDYRFMAPLARLLARKFGYKVTSMTYPGRLNFDAPNHDWPGDTINPDGSIRMPVWRRGEVISPDQVEIVTDTTMRARYGTRTNARARPGTLFYDRMAAWPAAFESAMKEICAREFPVGVWSVHVHGHSTGGPFVHMLTQRVANIVGVVGIENSPFGSIYQKMIGIEWTGPFNDLLIRTWRDIARYAGAEAFHQEGAAGLMRLPWLMEDVFERWNRSRAKPNFKAEYPLHYGCVPAMTEAARAVAARLSLNEADATALVERYSGYLRELSGPGVKPVPPILLGVAKFSRDHRPEIYESIVLPAFAAMQPAPKVRLIRFDAGTHDYERPETDLPMGLVPAVTKLWSEAIAGGFYASPQG